MCCVLYSVFVSSSNCCQEDYSGGDCLAPRRLFVCLSLVCAGAFCSVFRAESESEIHYDVILCKTALLYSVFRAEAVYEIYVRSIMWRSQVLLRFMSWACTWDLREINYVTQQWYIQFCCVFCTWDLLSWDLGDQLCDGAKFCCVLWELSVKMHLLYMIL